MRSRYPHRCSIHLQTGMRKPTQQNNTTERENLDPFSKHPNLLELKKMAGVTRLELATSGVTGRHSNQLSYTPAGDRTTLLHEWWLIYAGEPFSSSAEFSFQQQTATCLFAKRWWAMRDSNSRHLRCKRSALPTELIARRLACGW